MKHDNKKNTSTKSKILILVIVLLSIFTIVGIIVKNTFFQVPQSRSHEVAYEKLQKQDRLNYRKYNIHSKYWKPSKKYYKSGRGTITYSPMGDSLTSGFFATTESKDYVNVFSNYLEEGLGYNVNIDGIDGYGGISENGASEVEKVVEKNPDLVSIEYGTNDADPRRKISPTDLKKNIVSIIERLNSMNKPPKIFLITTWKTDTNGNYDNIIKEIGKKYNYPVVDISEIYQEDNISGPKGKQTFRGKSDNFHPNDKGMELIARQIYKKTNEYISK